MKEFGWTIEQFWGSTPKLFYGLLDAAFGHKVEKQKQGSKVIEHYDDLPAGAWI